MISPDDVSTKQIGMLAAAIAGLGAFWHAYRRVRSNLREDAASEKTSASYQEIIGQFETQIARLQSRVAAEEERSNKLEQRIHELSQRITDEINGRYAAEHMARRLEGERNALRAELDDLKGKNWEHGGA